MRVRCIKPILLPCTQRHAPRAACRNVYGPTETTIWSTLWKAKAGEAVQIGKPIRNTNLVILDDDNKPANQGSLWIGGIGLTPGARPSALTQYCRGIGLSAT